MNETKKFFIALFENKPDDTYIVIWQTPLKRTKRFKNISDAVKFINKIKNTKTQIYYGCGLQDKDHGPLRRGKKEDIVGIPGFYIDIDIKSPVHKNENLPETVDEAVNLTRNNGFDPTLIVHTGHGIHVYWLFKEPEIFTTDKDREESETMCRRLQETIKIKAEKKGWALDSTYDSTRVLRVPGTFNRKDKPVLVEVILDGGQMYTCVNDFDEFLIAEDQIEKITPAPTKQQQDVILKNITLSPTAAPPADMVDWLCEIDPKFKATYQNKRDPKSFPKGKASPSEYALSLASIAVQANWTDQEIADLIIDWYRRHGHDINKAMRGDYIARTLAVAKRGVDEEFAKHYEKNIEPVEGTDYHKDVDPELQQVKKMLSIEFGFKIIKLVKFAQEKHSHYVMHTDVVTENHNGKVNFPTEEHLSKQPKFRTTVLAKINRWVKTFTTKKWDNIVDKFTMIMEEGETSEPDVEDRMKSWLSDYLEGKKIYGPDETHGSREPFVKKNHWHVYEDTFSRWCYNHRGFLGGIEKTKLDLALIGSTKEKYNIKKPTVENPKARSSTYAFKIPLTIYRPVLKAAKTTDLDSHKGTDSGADTAPTVH